LPLCCGTRPRSNSRCTTCSIRGRTAELCMGLGDVARSLCEISLRLFSCHTALGEAVDVLQHRPRAETLGCSRLNMIPSTQLDILQVRLSLVDPCLHASPEPTPSLVVLLCGLSPWHVHSHVHACAKTSAASCCSTNPLRCCISSVILDWF
jgi:hypothetical protein